MKKKGFSIVVVSLIPIIIGLFFLVSSGWSTLNISNIFLTAGDNGYYGSSEDISVTNVTIEPNANVTFESGQSVTLGPEFAALEGCEFVARAGTYGTGTISGRVIIKNGSSYSGVSDMIVNLMQGTTTIQTVTSDLSGYYSFSNVPYGSYTVSYGPTTYRLSYQTYVQTVQSTNVVLPVVQAFDPSATIPVAGYTPGEFNVDDFGSANYSIPIQTPPGFHGMQPSLSLNYNSQGGDGMVGVGWSLSGLPAITRGPANLARDGYLQSVNYDSNDRFLFNGQPLILMEGSSYGAANTEYRTEIDNFTKVAFDGVQFVAKTRDGITMYFSTLIKAQGKSATSAWLLSDMYDRLGNRVHYAYLQNSATGEYWPDYIDYKYLKNATTGTCRVNFSYTARPQHIQSYVGGSLVMCTHLLEQITTTVNGYVVRNYVLTYDQNPASGRSRLTNVTEFDGAGKNLKPTTFAWQQPTSIGFTPKASSQNLAATGQGKHFILAGDTNGDGRQDIVLLEGATQYQSPLSVRVWTCNADGTLHDEGIIVENQFTKDTDDNFLLGDFITVQNKPRV